MRIVVAGGTGFVGGALIRRLVREGHHVVLLTRRATAAEAAQNVQACVWDGKNQGVWSQTLHDADAVINLAGESIAKRWSQAQKAKIIQSRLDATQALVTALRAAAKRPKVLINASAIGYYGHVPEGKVTESHPKGTGFLADTCAAWEQAAAEAKNLGVRVVLLRVGVVLEKGGGALAKMLPPFQFFVGGPLGKGSQWFSWIHRDDLIGAILFALRQEALSGPVNATAPNPATMQDFCRTLGRVMHRPSFAPVPEPVLKLLLGEMAQEMLLSGQRVIPARLQESGYAFQHPLLEEALHAILDRQSI